LPYSRSSVAISKPIVEPALFSTTGLLADGLTCHQNACYKTSRSARNIDVFTHQITIYPRHKVFKVKSISSMVLFNLAA